MSVVLISAASTATTELVFVGEARETAPKASLPDWLGDVPLGSWVEEEGMELFWDAWEYIVAWLNVVDKSMTTRDGDAGRDDILFLLFFFLQLTLPSLPR